MRIVCWLAAILVTVATGSPAAAELRLVPYPKVARTLPGRFTLPGRAIIATADTPAARQAARDLADDLAIAARVASTIVAAPARSDGDWELTLVGPARGQALRPVDRPSEPEGYGLRILPKGAAVAARTPAGLLRGVATLRQLVRANLQGRTLPCVEIQDYPALARRGFLDDITRGPCPTLAQLQREAGLAAYLRMNFLTYYLEHQFAYRSRPDIGPKGGSLTADELARLARFADSRGVEVIGCQQSFGHFGNILSHPEYASLRETADVLNPTDEGSYRLLDDLYGDQMPSLLSHLFLVCCDETYGLGTGPSKALAQQIGVGGVYARHLQRVHQLVTGKYGKRMMMWGDIILQHPENLGDIPKDTIMLSWAYHAAPSFDTAIVPFVKAGYDFMVCPGANNWSRILPDFQTACINIRNYVRDGTRHGAMGMLNTTWDDDGETLFGPNWHALAWGAECAWSGSTTPLRSFNRRIGGVLFGERGDHFGQAIGLLSRTHALPGYQGMFDARFWETTPRVLPVDRASTVRQARELLEIVEPAIGHLEQARHEARWNREVLDTYLLGARRMRLMARRTLDHLRAAAAYERAYLGVGSRRAAEADVRATLLAAEGTRSAYASVKAEYVRLWQTENRPYALDRVSRRYDAAIAECDRLASRLRGALAAARAARPLPSPATMGLAISVRGARRTQPDRLAPTPLAPSAPWLYPAFPYRIGVVVGADGHERGDQPVDVVLPPSFPRGGTGHLVEVGPDGRQQDPLPCQIEAHGPVRRLVFVARGPMAANSRRAFLLYCGAPVRVGTQPPNSVALARATGGSYWVQNDQIRLLVGREGAHIYRWIVRALQGRDLTEPGDRDWAGFADINGVYRNSLNQIDVEASGPVRARLRCTDPSGLTKTFDVWAGVPWVECTLNAASGWFALYDDIRVMGADSETPGLYLFENGDTGRLRPITTDTSCQERRDGQRWCAKYVPGGPLLALLTPEAANTHVVGPGSGMGALFIEGPPESAHFVIVGGVAPADPRRYLDLLRSSLDYAHPPRVELHRAESRPLSEAKR